MALLGRGALRQGNTWPGGLSGGGSVLWMEKKSSGVRSACTCWASGWLGAARHRALNDALGVQEVAGDGLALNFRKCVEACRGSPGSGWAGPGRRGYWRR